MCDGFFVVEFNSFKYVIKVYFFSWEICIFKIFEQVLRDEYIFLLLGFFQESDLVIVQGVFFLEGYLVFVIFIV